MVAAVQGDGKPCCGEDGRLPAAASGRRACRLSSGADRARGLHLARACGGACRARPRGRLSNRVDLRAWRGFRLQKKAFCRASKTGLISPASGRAGKPIRGRSIPGGSFSSMRPGPRPIWRPCGASGVEGSKAKAPYGHWGVSGFSCVWGHSITAGGGLWRSRRTHWINYSWGAIERRCFPKTLDSDAKCNTPAP